MAKALKAPSPAEITFVQNEILGGDQQLYIKWMTKRKRDKVQERLVVLSKYKLFTIKKTFTGKLQVQRSGHLLDLKEMTSSDIDRVIIYFKDFFVDVQESSAMELMTLVRQAFARISVGFPEQVLPKMNLFPAERQLPQLQTFDVGPANGLPASYEAYCDFYKLRPSSEFIKFVTDLSNKGVKTLNLNMCPGIERKVDPIDYLPIASALRHNTYFHSFEIRNIFKKDIIMHLAVPFEKNITMTRVVLSNIGITDTAAVALGAAFKHNENNRFVEIDLSMNPKIGDKGLMTLSEGFASFKHSLNVLNLANIGASHKSIASLIQAISLYSKEVTASLVELDLSLNQITTSSMNIATWLGTKGSAPVLRNLLLSGSKADIGYIAKSLRNGDLKYLELLDFSNNKIDQTSASAISELVEQMPSLKTLNLTDAISFPPASAVQIIKAIMRSDSKEVSVNFTNVAIGMQTATPLADAFKEATNIKSLVLKNCDLRKEGIVAFVERGLAHNKTVKMIDLSLNFNVGNAQKMSKAVVTLAQTVLAHPSLEHLSIAGDGNKKIIGKDIIPFCKMMGQNPKLMELDISGNKTGDLAASTLADALSTNTNLKLLLWDRNGISYGGWQALSNALDLNKTLVDVPQPRYDIERSNRDAKSAEEAKERSKEIMETIFQKLKSNSGNQKYVSTHMKARVGRHTVSAAIAAQQQQLQPPPSSTGGPQPSTSGPSPSNYSAPRSVPPPLSRDSRDDTLRGSQTPTYGMEQPYKVQPYQTPSNKNTVDFSSYDTSDYGANAYETGGGYDNGGYDNGGYDLPPPPPPPQDYGGVDYDEPPPDFNDYGKQENYDYFDEDAPPPPPPPPF